MFGDLAPRYDLLNHLLSFQIDRRWRRSTVAACLRSSDHRVLDLCCGTGDLTLEFARRMQPGKQVVGADFAHPMLRLFERKLSRRSTLDPRPATLEADSLVLPFADDQFDVVSVAFGLRNLDSADRGIAEMTRVVRRGGRVTVLDFCPPARLRLRHRVFRFYFHRISPLIGRLISRHMSAYRYLPQSVETFPPRERLEEIMRERGLHVVVSRNLTGGIATLLVGEKQ
jgi:demethylmenaquinone methyltransferase/2-methoxy-6-polyprenyl-1,4-benzoquinol methylase